MAQLYSPKDENLRELTTTELVSIFRAVKFLEGKLPHEFCSDLNGIRFYEDKGMDTDNGVMGYTSYLSPNRILLCPGVVQGLTHEVKGVPDNEQNISTVIHELTHRNQRTWGYGVAWFGLNLPIIDQMTIEKWARENEAASIVILSAAYAAMRRVNKEHDNVKLVNS